MSVVVLSGSVICQRWLFGGRKMPEAALVYVSCGIGVWSLFRGGWSLLLVFFWGGGLLFKGLEFIAWGLLSRLVDARGVGGECAAP